MEGMNLAKLEAVVERMLNNIGELKRDKAGLQAKLEAREATIADLEARISAMASNQEEVSSRVSNLLRSIEDWERSADPEIEESEVVDPDTKEDLPSARGEKNSGGLFSIGE